MSRWTRRTLIGAGGLIGGGLALGVGAIAIAPDRLAVAPRGNGRFARLTTWIRITPDNRITAVIPHCEMGQGALTGLAMMLAEELDADWSTVAIEEASAVREFANGYVFRGFAEEVGLHVPPWLAHAMDYGTFRAAVAMQRQTTGGSLSTRATGQFGMRIAGAAARSMLLSAAARRLRVAPQQLTTRDSFVSDSTSGQRLSYGELASEAALSNPPSRPLLKRPSQYRLVGQDQRRHDIPSKVDGTALYAIDVALPELLYATIAAAPTPVDRLEPIDPTLATSLSGVISVVQLDAAVAVVADGYWSALQGLRALAPAFFPSRPVALDSSEKIFAAHAAALGRDRAVTTGRTSIAVEYRVPYLAHATLEPMSATARISNGRCEVWAGTQDPLNARRAAANAAGVDLINVQFHNLQLGGSFGRRLPGCFDYIEQAVEIAKSTSPRPVKLIWSREEDMRHDYYRPAVIARLNSELDSEGRPQSWRSRFTGSAFLDASAATPIYRVGDPELEAVEPPPCLRTGSWRSVAHSQHGFFTESFVDELAAAAGQDPYEYRLALLAHKPRHRNVLKRAAALAGWTAAPPAGRGRGIAIVESFGTVVAEVAEISMTGGSIRVHRVSAVVDCGEVINPNQARAQIEGGIIFGLSAALYQQITVADGRVEQANFPDYEMIRLATAPRIDIEFVASDAPMGGLGEPGVPPIAPAVANALFALTGRRLRQLPLRLAQAAENEPVALELRL